MALRTEPQGYEKTILSDLQGAWENLREDVVAAHPFPESDRILLHIDEGMSWESVRDLEKMQVALLLVKNLAEKKTVRADIRHAAQEVWDILEETRSELGTKRRR